MFGHIAPYPSCVIALHLQHTLISLEIERMLQSQKDEA